MEKHTAMHYTQPNKLNHTHTQTHTHSHTHTDRHTQSHTVTQISFEVDMSHNIPWFCIAGFLVVSLPVQGTLLG